MTNSAPVPTINVFLVPKLQLGNRPIPDNGFLHSRCRLTICGLQASVPKLELGNQERLSVRLPAVRRENSP